MRAYYGRFPELKPQGNILGCGVEEYKTRRFWRYEILSYALAAGAGYALLFWR